MGNSTSTRLQKYFKKMAASWQYYILIIPALAGLIIFCYWPIYGITLAFKDFRFKLGIMGSPWVGLEHFEDLLGGLYFPRSIRNTVIISLIRTVFGFPAPIILALLLNEIRHRKYKRIVQTISYFPHFLSWIVVGGILIELLSPSRGAVNTIISMLGGKPIYFLGSNDHFRGVLVVTGIWKNVGWGTIIYLAAISGLDVQMYEAARIDGATRFQQVWHITIPGISSVVILIFILSLGRILNAGFDQIFNLYNAAVFETGDIIDTYVYRMGLQNMEYSRGTAAGLFKNVVGFVLVLGTDFIAKKVSGGEHGIF